MPSSGPLGDETLVRVPVEPTPSGDKRATKGRAGRIVAIVAGVVVVLALGFYAIGYFLAGDKLPRNASVAGVPIGGLDRDGAIDRLTAELGPKAAAPIRVTINGAEDEVKPADAGITIDYGSTVDQAGAGRSLNPRHIWAVLTGGSAINPVVSTDAKQLQAAVAALAKEHDQAAKDATLAFEGSKIVSTKSSDGVMLDQTTAPSAISGAFLSGRSVDLKAATSAAQISTDDVAEVVEGFAEPAVAAPIKVTAGQSGQFQVSPEMIGNSISFEAADGTLKPKFDGAELFKQARNELKKVELTKPKDATVAIRDTKPVVLPAVNGTTVTAENLAKAVEPALTKSGNDRTVSVELSGAKAKFGTDDAKKLGIDEVIGEFTTRFPYAEYRNVNIGRAAEKINGTVLKPGETFSLNVIVGERTRANGFVEGNIITGSKFKLELGGGVSQSATTTYNAMFFAGLKDIQHQPHSLYIDRYPAGREATVAWPTLDLKFQNDTKYGVLVQAFVNKASPGNQGSITVRMWSTKTYDEIKSSALRKSNFTTGREIWDTSSSCQEMYPVQGFDVNYSRLFYNDGKLVKTQNFHWRYDPTDRVHCGKDPNS